MKFTSYAKLLGWLLVAIVFASCEKSCYLDVIPKDVTFVAYVDTKQISKKGDLSNSSILGTMKDYLGIMVTGEERKYIEDLFEHPEKMGIDFSQPLYVFKTTDGCMGITMRIEDVEDFEDFLNLLTEQGLSGKTVEREGLKYNSLFDDIDFAYNDDALLFLMSLNKEGSAMAKYNLAKLWELGEEERFVSTPKFEKLKDINSDVAAYSNLASLSQDIVENIKLFLPNGVRPIDIEVLSSVNFEDGKLVLAMDMYSENEKVQKILKSEGAHLKRLKGNYLESPSDNFFVWASAGVEGEWLLTTLKQSKEIKQLLFLLERGIDIEMMIKAIDGDVAIVLPQSFITSESEEIDFIAMADIKNSDFLKDVDYWKSSMTEYGMSMREIDNNHYLFKANNYNVHWGVDNKSLFFATDEAYKQNAFSKRSDLLKPYESDIKESTLFVYLNLDALPMAELGYMTGMGAVLSDKLTKFKSVIFRVNDASHFELSIEMKSKDENILKQLLN